MGLPKLLPVDNLKYTKPQVDQFVRANGVYIKTIGITGSIAIVTALITAIKEHNKHIHEEKMAEHEEKMLSLEIEKMKLESERNL